jgi:hypothetical protein
MSSAVAELDGYLQSMQSLKPPGVSGSKIGSITQLCVANIQVSPLSSSRYLSDLVANAISLYSQSPF